MGLRAEPSSFRSARTWKVVRRRRHRLSARRASASGAARGLGARRLGGLAASARSRCPRALPPPLMRPEVSSESARCRWRVESANARRTDEKRSENDAKSVVADQGVRSADKAQQRDNMGGQRAGVKGRAGLFRRPPICPRRGPGALGPLESTPSRRTMQGSRQNPIQDWLCRYENNHSWLGPFFGLARHGGTNVCNITRAMPPRSNVARSANN